MLTKTYEGYRVDKERRTALYIEFIVGVLKWGLVGFLLITYDGCSPNLPTFSIDDTREIEHSYSKSIDLNHQEKTALYCKSHFKWEIITAFYNPNSDKYDYFVVKHRKEK